MAEDLPWLRQEIADRIAAEPGDSSFFVGHPQRVRNLVASAVAAGLYTSVYNNVEHAFISISAKPDPFPKP